MIVFLAFSLKLLQLEVCCLQKTISCRYLWYYDVLSCLSNWSIFEPDPAPRYLDWSTTYLLTLLKNQPPITSFVPLSSCSSSFAFFSSFSFCYLPLSNFPNRPVPPSIAPGTPYQDAPGRGAKCGSQSLGWARTQNLARRGSIWCPRRWSRQLHQLLLEVDLDYQYIWKAFHGPEPLILPMTSPLQNCLIVKIVLVAARMCWVGSSHKLIRYCRRSSLWLSMQIPWLLLSMMVKMVPSGSSWTPLPVLACRGIESLLSSFLRWAGRRLAQYYRVLRRPS